MHVCGRGMSRTRSHELHGGRLNLNCAHNLGKKKRVSNDQLRERFCVFFLFFFALMLLFACGNNKGYATLGAAHNNNHADFAAAAASCLFTQQMPHLQTPSLRSLTDTHTHARLCPLPQPVSLNVTVSPKIFEEKAKGNDLFEDGEGAGPASGVCVFVCLFLFSARSSGLVVYCFFKRKLKSWFKNDLILPAHEFDGF